MFILCTAGSSVAVISIGRSCIVQVVQYVQADAKEMAAISQRIAFQNSNFISTCIPLLVRAVLHVQARTSRSLHVAVAAARRAGSSREAPSRSRLLSPGTSAEKSADVIRASSISTFNASNSLGCGLQSTIQLLKYALDPLFERWGLLAPTRRNYRAGGAMALPDSLKLEVRHFNAMMDRMTNDMPAECSYLLQTHPRYLGTIPGLVEEAERKGGKMSPEDVRKWLIQHPEVLANIPNLQGGGLKPSDLEKGNGSFHIDHILPDSKSGCSHPMNYIIMEASANQSFGGRISLEKCLYVGPAMMVAVIMFHAEKLPSAGFDLQAVQLAMVPVYHTLQ